MNGEVPLIRPSIFSGYPVECRMTTRIGGVSPQPFGMNLSFRVGDYEEHVKANRRVVFGKLGVSDGTIVFGEQCHSTTVREVSRGGTYPACDGFMTTEPNLWLAVSIADCAPIFLYDMRQRLAAALHAGWRGTKGGIVGETVERMKREKGTRPEELLAFIGPSAGVCCYEVGDDVAAEFSNGVVVRRDGKKFVDLKMANRKQLLAASVPVNNIEVHPDCTICNPDRYHSYRRDKELSGRMMAFIALTKEG
jgi:hypothetical protein